jgi:hypothetical protein
MPHFHYALVTAALAGALFLAMLLFIELGRRMGVRQLKSRGTEARAGVGLVDGTVYGLLALLMGFSFSGAATRFDQRRDLVGQEANALGTAWLRLDLLPAEKQGAVRGAFRRYVDALIAAYAEFPGLANAAREPPGIARAQHDLWGDAVAVCLTPGGEPARILLLPALNEAFDTVERERLARRIHPPLVIWAMLGLAALAAGLFAGYDIAPGPSRNWIYILGVAATVSVAAYVVIELEYPRIGLVRIDAIDQTLVDLRATLQ